MKICLIGKYPPIQGGVSTRNFAFAHSLAQQGHTIHVVTNAKDVRAPFRMFMREEDWQKCEADYGEGSVTVHWTDRADTGQFHIPMSPAYVTKLSSLAIEVCRKQKPDVILGFYMEPYGIATYLASAATDTPYVIMTAGSDTGRLWKQAQFKPLFDHVFRQARRIVAGSALRNSLVDIGVQPENLWPDSSFTVPENLFTPEGDALDVADFMSAAGADERFASLVLGTYDPSLPYIGVYGKLGEKKGTFALLEALRAVLDEGIEAGLMVLGHERPRSERKFRDAVKELELEDHVVQLPFVPNWRVPSFIRCCTAICCLEQDFPIKAHAPIAPREVLVAGGCLIASFEMLDKLPGSHRLVDGYNCVGVENVFDVADLAHGIKRVLLAPDAARAVGLRGRAYATREQATMPFPDRLASILAGAVENQPQPRRPVRERRIATPQSAWSVRAAAAFGAMPPDGKAIDPDALCELLKARFDEGDIKAGIYLDLVRIERALQSLQTPVRDDETDNFSRAHKRLANGKLLSDAAEIGSMVPRQIEPVLIVALNFDGNALLAAMNETDLPALTASQPNAVAIMAGEGGALRALVLSNTTATALAYSDGTRSVRDILAQMTDRHPSAPGPDATAELFLGLLENGLIRLSAP